MFESLRPDPGERGLTRAARIFDVLAVLSGIASILFLVLALIGDRPASTLRLLSNFAFAALAYIIARGIEHQKRWAKWLGYIFAVFELMNVPIGTVIGIAVIVYLHRASKAGLFEAPVLK